MVAKWSLLRIEPQTPSTVYAATDGGGLFKSVDGGGQWLRVANSDLVFVSAVAIDPSTPTTIYALSRNRGLFKTTDAGNIWNNLGIRREKAIAIDPQTPATLYVVRYAGPQPEADTGPFVLLKSTNGGASWTNSNAGSPQRRISDIAVDPLSPNIVYAASLGVFKSVDRGGTWSNTGLQASAWNIVIDPRTSTTLYAFSAVATPGSLFKSADGGATWAALASAPLSYARLPPIRRHPTLSMRQAAMASSTRSTRALGERH